MVDTPNPEGSNQKTTFFERPIVHHERFVFTPAPLSEDFQAGVYSGVNFETTQLVAEMDLDAAGQHHFAVFENKTPTSETERFYVLQMTPTGQTPEGKTMYDSTRGFPLQPGQSLLLGRENGFLSKLSPDVSNKHATIALDGDGKLSVEDHSTNGTKNFKYAMRVDESFQSPNTEIDESTRRNPYANDAALSEAAPHEPATPEVIQPSIDKYMGVYDDPVFSEVVTPYKEQIHELETQRLTQVTQLEREVEQARRRGDDPYGPKDKVEAAIDYYAEQVQAVRDQLEEAVKPYLSARLAQFKGDKSAAYVHPDTLIVERDKVTSPRRKGTPIAHRTPDYWTQATYPRMGQVTLPTGWVDWATGRGNSTTGTSFMKSNHQTGGKKSSGNHIVDLAAAAVAGNWKGEHDPVQFRRDEAAEYDLPPNLQGKIRLFKPVRGMHRVAVDRLLDGIDAQMGGEILN